MNNNNSKWFDLGITRTIKLHYYMNNDNTNSNDGGSYNYYIPTEIYAPKSIEIKIVSSR